MMMSISSDVILNSRQKIEDIYEWKENQFKKQNSNDNKGDNWNERFTCLT